MSLGVLGDLVFEVSSSRVRTWQSQKRTRTARFAEHEVYAGKPLTEFEGDGLDEITLSVRLDATRGVVPQDELDALAEQKSIGAALQFTVGGKLVGDFTIRSIHEDHVRHDARGVLQLAIVEITLREYV